MWVEEANGTILLYDRERESSTRLVTGFDNHFPVWTPEGDRIAFRSNREGPFNVFWQTVDGSDQAERLGTSEYGQVPYSFSPDGKLLGYMEERPRSGADIFILSLEGDRSPEPYVQTRFNEDWPAFSPDGRFIAYQSDESGEPQIYIETYPRSRSKWRVSTEGGVQPWWNPRGGELFYREGPRTMVVDVDTSQEVSHGTPEALFESEAYVIGVMPDGQSFVTIDVPDVAAVPPRNLVFVQHWTDELNRLVPTH